jgi:hypothetical protein
VLDELRRRAREQKQATPLDRTMLGVGPGGAKG